MSVWKIGTVGQTYAQAATFASIKADDLRRRLVACGQDEVSFRCVGATALTDAELFAYKTRHIVWKDGAKWFVGLVTTIPRYGSDQEESRRYTLAGPWWFFQECTYQQSWRVYDETGEELSNVNKSRVILFQGADGNRCSTGAQVGNVVDWLIARGAPIQKGTIDAGIEMAYDEQINLSCAGVIEAVLRWTPDYVCWFDYSTSPHPTFHFRKKSNLSAVSRAVGSPVTDLRISPRYDLQKPGVHITYERVNQIDEHSYTTVAVDSAGDLDQVDTVFGAFDLAGSMSTFMKQKIVVDEFPEVGHAIYVQGLNSKNWWKERVPWLATIPDADLTIVDGARADDSALPRILVEGNVQEWMNCDIALETVTCKVTAIIRDEDNVEVERLDKKIESVQLHVTDAHTKTYRRIGSFDGGEPTPTGVAAALYASWSQLHWEGGFKLLESECSGAFLPGNVLNFTGGMAAWTSINALIRSISENVDEGISDVEFGPNTQIEAGTLVALFRALRVRNFAYQYKARTTAESEGNAVEAGGKDPLRVASSSPGEKRKLVVSDEVEETIQKLSLDPGQVEFEDEANLAATEIRPREALVPEVVDGNQVLKLRQVLCGASYGTPISLAGGQGIDFSKFRLGYQISGGSIVLLAGKLKLGNRDLAVAQSSIPLGGVQWFYVHHVRSSAAASWQVAAAEPSITDSAIDVPCFHFVDSVFQEACHVGDITFDLPLV